MNKNIQTLVITIDGPSGSGKGTIAQMLAKELGWNILDSGALYRAMAWGVMHYAVDSEDHAALQILLESLKIELSTKNGELQAVICDGVDVTTAIRHQSVSAMASKISAIPLVRTALLARQRSMRRLPGLVTDGRDMGTVVFPDAPLKFYFQADPDERAKRRYEQLKAKGIDANLRDIRQELAIRDHRDENREIAPSKPAPDMVVIDTTSLNIHGVFRLVMEHVKKLGVF